MVHALRGWGKSRFIHDLAVHLYGGLDFLRYTCPEPRSVLLVDGEFPREELQIMLRRQTVPAPLHGRAARVAGADSPC